MLGDQRGAVLSADEILELCEGRSSLMTDYDEGNFIGAKYDLRMATTGIVLPTGQFIDPDADEPYKDDILLEPGETIFISTRERLRMPAFLSGNMSIKGDLSRHGILSLTGMIVDPGYRPVEPHEMDKCESKLPIDGRLHFRLANLGARTVVLKPGETRIASIQFLRLSKPSTKLIDITRLPNPWAREEELEEGLGFIEELRTLQGRLSRLTSEFEQQKRSVTLVIVAGLFVILTTLLGVAVTGLLSLGADSDVVDSAKNVIPDDPNGRAVSAVVIIGLAAIVVMGLIGIANRISVSAYDIDEMPRVVRRREAIHQARILRARRIALYAVAVAAALALALAIPISRDESIWLILAAPVVVLLVAIWGFTRYAWKQITQEDLQKLLRKWDGLEPQ